MMLSDFRAEFARQWEAGREERRKGWADLMADPQQSWRLVTVWLANCFGFWALWMLVKYLLLNRRPSIPDGGTPGEVGDVVQFKAA